MRQPIQLTSHQLDALANDATALLFMVDEKALKIWENSRNSTLAIIEDDKVIKGGFDLDKYLRVFSPLQPNQECYVQEGSKQEIGGYNTFVPASKMTYEQSRDKFTVKSVEVKRLSDLSCKEVETIKGIVENYFDSWIDEQYGQGTYSSNPYCFYAVIDKGE